MSVKRAWICESGVPTFQDCDWKGNKVIFKKNTLGERLGQGIFVRACFGPTKKSRFSVVILEGEGGVPVMRCAKVEVLIGLRCGREGEESEVSFVQYM